MLSKSSGLLESSIGVSGFNVKCIFILICKYFFNKCGLGFYSKFLLSSPYFDLF